MLIELDAKTARKVAAHDPAADHQIDNGFGPVPRSSVQSLDLRGMSGTSTYSIRRVRAFCGQVVEVGDVELYGVPASPVVDFPTRRRDDDDLV